MKLIKTIFAGLTVVASMNAHAGFMLNGADLLTDPNTTLSASRGFAANGTSVTYNGVENGTVAGIIEDTNSGVNNAGDTYSFSVDVTQVTSDTDFGWGVTDGVNNWGMLTFDLGAHLGKINGAFGGLDSVSNIDFSGLTASGIPGVGNSGTIKFDFLFGADSTTVTISGDYYDTISAGTFVDDNAFTFGNSLSVVLFSGGGSETYQIDKIGSGSGSTTPVSSPYVLSLVLAGLSFVLFRNRK